MKPRAKLGLTFLVIIAIAVALWGGAACAISWYVPVGSAGEEYANRGQFGDMFGAVSCLLSAITLGLIAYSTWDSTERGTNTDRWRTNYEYLREAKLLICNHPEILQLHGIDLDESFKDTDARSPVGSAGTMVGKPTAAQVTYVIMDMKAADLFYKMGGDLKYDFTEYRKALLNKELYRNIVEKVIIPGDFIDGKFIAAVEKFYSQQDQGAPNR
jgi:hypothetical protein